MQARPIWASVKIWRMVCCPEISIYYMCNANYWVAAHYRLINIYKQEITMLVLSIALDLTTKLVNDDGDGINGLSNDSQNILN